ncbi:MAG: VWA domain-containing protein [Bacteroidota bacterium]
MRILFIFDASNSMRGSINGKTKMEHAKQMFCRLFDSLSRKKNYEFALRMYGSTVAYPPGDCNDSKLVVPFQKNNNAIIKQKVNAAKPTGITPIEKSLTKSAGDFPDQNAENVVILITDGLEECGGDPCLAKAELEKKGIVIHPYIIGIGLTEQQAKAFDCVGTFINGENPGDWDKINGVLEQLSVNRTSAQINLLDQNSQPTETNVNMTIFDQKSGNMLFNYVHSLIAPSNADTIFSLSENRTYRIVVNTIPPVEKKNVQIFAGKHNIIPIDCPQGYLRLNWAFQKNHMIKQNKYLSSIIRKSGESQTLHVQSIDSKEKYLLGTYDLEILTLPRTYINQVKINQSLETKLEIPLPGKVNVTLKEPGEGSILLNDNGKMIHVINLDKNKTDQVFMLQPGQYNIVWRASKVKSTIFTIEKSFKVDSEKEYTIDLISK